MTGIEIPGFTTADMIVWFWSQHKKKFENVVRNRVNFSVSSRSYSVWKSVCHIVGLCVCVVSVTFGSGELSVIGRRPYASDVQDDIKRSFHAGFLDTNTVEPLLTETSIIRTPPYYRQFIWSESGKKSYKFNRFNTDISIIPCPFGVRIIGCDCKQFHFNNTMPRRRMLTNTKRYLLKPLIPRRHLRRNHGNRRGLRWHMGLIHSTRLNCTKR